MVTVRSLTLLLVVLLLATAKGLKCFHGCGKSTVGGEVIRDSCNSSDNTHIADGCKTCYGISLSYTSRSEGSLKIQEQKIWGTLCVQEDEVSLCRVHLPAKSKAPFPEGKAECKTYTCNEDLCNGDSLSERSGFPNAASNNHISLTAMALLLISFF